MATSPKPFSATVSSSFKWRDKNSDILNGSLRTPESCGNRAEYQACSRRPASSLQRCCGVGWCEDGEKPYLNLRPCSGAFPTITSSAWRGCSKQLCLLAQHFPVFKPRPLLFSRTYFDGRTGHPSCVTTELLKCG